MHGFGSRLVDVEISTSNNPIRGLKDTEDYSLEEAIKIAQQKDKEFQSEEMEGPLFLAHDFAESKKNDPYHLTQDEIAAINLYTQETSLYKILNARLRNSNRDFVRPFFPYIKLLMKGLFKLPQVKTTVYRGINKNLESEYPEGKKPVWWGFSSTSSNIKVLNVQTFFDTTKERTMFHIKTETAVSIQEYSANPQEDEVLLLPGTCLIVEGALPAGPGLRIIQAKESPPVSGLIDFVRK